MVTTIGRSQRAVVGITTEVFPQRVLASLQRSLLLINAALHVRAARSVYLEARARLRDERGAAEAYPPRAIVQCQVEIVVHSCAWPLRLDVRGDCVGPAEELQCLVDHVRSEIGEDSRARRRDFAPAFLDFRPEAVPACFEQEDFSECRKDLAHRQIVAVPAPIVEDGQDPF